MENQLQYSDETFMHRAIDLARLGAGKVSPNPLVGCVIVHDNKIIGEGWHQQYGEAHAEVNAINSVADRSLIKESTLYVSLEPCSHFGKTPPCADLIIRMQAKRVVIANVDTNPLVGGSGIKKLKEANIEVRTGVLEAEGRELNKRFFTSIEKQRPYIILKWAQTKDGYIARENFDSKWISSEVSRKLVHKWRSEEDAILVGTNTARHDNPKLNVRLWNGRDPVRVVIDKKLSLSKSLHLFDGTQPTICYNFERSEKESNLEFVKLQPDNFINLLVHDLHIRKIQSLIIEGGTQTLQTFIDAELWDEARVFTSPELFQAGIKSPILNGNLVTEETLGKDVLRLWIPEGDKSKRL
jgi:diaminohydroxyphosphoribosylaminopyrimidine deaminase/5-amino-6-(5-phosphoribosylamino)uracil reductase